MCAQDIHGCLLQEPVPSVLLRPLHMKALFPVLFLYIQPHSLLQAIPEQTGECCLHMQLVDCDESFSNEPLPLQSSDKAHL